MVYLHCFPTLQAPWKQSSSLSVLPGLLNKKLTDSWATIHASYFKPLSLGEGVVTQQELTSTSYLSPVQSISRVRLFATPWIEARQASLSITNSHSLPKLMSIELVMPSSHLILLSSPFPPAPNPSQHQSLFKWVSSSHKVAKVLEFQLKHQSFQWTPRTDLL